eukprot:CAMPEP_0116908662 /NCGR_PEP_ID=MMETSP0467-20121206/13824_1 /TAXON_ID=283647 /ORGANISM="Mesodinium pulex, Strain SPMC105" /LENGTH=74 /DNA_ID=CAMNT_0004583893 /DNA_START=510 /DNA_END=734 /DNA_ORIENTATION=-
MEENKLHAQKQQEFMLKANLSYSDYVVHKLKDKVSTHVKDTVMRNRERDSRFIDNSNPLITKPTLKNVNQTKRT